MNKLATGLFGVTLLTLSYGAETAPRVPCPTCDREIIVSWDGAKCLQRKLPEQLGRSQDPILVSIANCGKPNGDRLRQEQVPNLVSTQRKRERGTRLVFLLTRADAQCLYTKLRARSMKTPIVHIDLTTC